jgi:adenylate kinase
MHLVFLGPPGSGKGTQAKALADKLKIAHISTGDVLRNEIKMATELGLLAKSFMDMGELVPDDLMLKMIKDILQKKPDGFIFDGFPRTAAQAEGLENLLNELGKQIDAVIYLTAKDEDLLKRLQGRYYCADCDLDYNINTRPPKMAGICDSCGEKLRQRSDDTDEVILHRLDVYRERTKPVEEFYRLRGLLKEIDGSQPPDRVTSLVMGAVG